jgi:hypothetical protein
LIPPPFVPTVSLFHKFRFSNGGNSGTYTIARQQLLNLLLVAQTTVLSVRLFQAIRLRKVEIWANPTALGSTPSTVSIEWLGENSPSTVISDTTMGVRPAHISSKPPARSSAQWWSLNAFNEYDVLFILTLPAQCIIDVSVDLRYVEQEAPTLGDVPAGATAGQVYGDYLDGIATSKLAPVGFIALP